MPYTVNLLYYVGCLVNIHLKSCRNAVGHVGVRLVPACANADVCVVATVEVVCHDIIIVSSVDLSLRLVVRSRSHVR